MIGDQFGHRRHRDHRGLIGGSDFAVCHCGQCRLDDDIGHPHQQRLVRGDERLGRRTLIGGLHLAQDRFEFSDPGHVLGGQLRPGRTGPTTPAAVIPVLSSVECTSGGAA